VVKELKALVVWTDYVDQLEILVQQDQKDKLVILDRLAILVHKGNRELQVQLAILESLAQRDRKAKEDLLDKLVP